MPPSVDLAYSPTLPWVHLIDDRELPAHILNRADVWCNASILLHLESRLTPLRDVSPGSLGLPSLANG